MSNKKPIKHIDIESIQDPIFLKELNYKELDTLCFDLREYLIDKVSINGGHLSSNLGVVEATVALCKTFDFSKDKIIFDVGHQSYTYKVLTGRKLDNLRKKDGISGFQKMSESKYDHYEAGHSSTSISAALGMATARDLKKENYNVIAFIGDASITNGLAMEGINCGANDPHKIIVFLNDNEMSISKNVGGLSKLFRKFSNSAFYLKTKNVFYKFFNTSKPGRAINSFLGKIKNWFKRHLIQLSLFDYLGYGVIGPIDGHNVKKMCVALEKAKKSRKSTIILVKTKKGKGYQYSEKDVFGKWHGVSPFDKETGKTKNNDESKTSWSKHYALISKEIMEKNENCFLIVPATMYGSNLKKVFSEFESRTKDVGIAEEHGVVYASGLAIEGYHPIISMYSTFMQRTYDEISHDLARMNLNATILIDRAGLVGEDGNTHQGIYDEGFLYSIPNTVIAMATTPNESRSIFLESLNNHGVFAIRYPKGSFNNDEINEIFDVSFGKWTISSFDTAKKQALIGVGPNLIKVKNLLKEQNKEVTVIKAIYLKPLDLDALSSLLDYQKIVVYDSYSTINGFASYVLAKLMELGYQGQAIIKAVPDKFIDEASVSEQEESLGLLPMDIASLF